jgi:hypothetical protein
MSAIVPEAPLSIESHMKPHPLAGDGASLTDRPTALYTGWRVGSGTKVLRHATDGSTSSLPWRFD